MRIGLFTDTYFPQVSGVATSIKTLKQELEKQGHEVYIFTATEKNIKQDQDPTIIRLPSVPFVSFSERRVVYRGLLSAYKIAKEHKLDIIHTQTEFSMGIFGKVIGNALKIPVVHTYHTQYEDYVHYIAKGKVIRPSMVKYIVRDYLSNLDGVICPSRIVYNVLEGYSVKIPKVIIPTGINLEKFDYHRISDEDCQSLRDRLGIASDETFLLSLSRISSEKNIQAVIKDFPKVLEINEKVKLVICGDGPYRLALEELVTEMGLESYIQFTGMIGPDETNLYYKTADFFISASTSETQGLTYLESLACETPIIAHANPYLDDLMTSKSFGTLYQYETDIADAIIEAIINTPPTSQVEWEAKRREISSETFGQAVQNFYLDTIIRKENNHEKQVIALTSEHPLPFNLVKSTIRLPKKVVNKTAETSAKVIKVPKKMVGSIKEFLD